MQRLFVLLAFLASLFSNSGVRAGEQEERQEIYETTRAAFLEERFDALDALAANFRETKARTPSGVWKLSAFYSTFDTPYYLDPNFGEAAATELEDKAERWTQSNPQSAAAHIVYAMMLMNHAVLYRGTGTAETVSRVGWEGFRRYQREAHRHLADLKATASTDPHWYVMMVQMAKAEGWPDADFDALFAEATQREPQYYTFYIAALERNMPRWGGSIYKMQDVLQDAVTLTFQTDGISMFARGYWNLSSYYDGDDLFRDTEADWNDVRIGFEDLIRRYPDPWNLNGYAMLACMAGDHEVAADLFKRIGDDIAGSLWDLATLKNCMSIVHRRQNEN